VTDTTTDTEARQVAEALWRMGARNYEHATTATGVAAHRLCPIPRTRRFFADHAAAVRDALARAEQAGHIERRLIDGMWRWWTPHYTEEGSA
jgi:hypothetical protein